MSEQADRAAMNTHPETNGAAVAPESVGVVAPGRAGWRGRRGLAPPANLVLLELPPYNPEPDPMETVFRYPRGNRLANRVFADAAAVAEARRKAWDPVRRRVRQDRLHHAPRVGCHPRAGGGQS